MERTKIRKRADLSDQELGQIRTDFAKLTLQNPNYFGNIPDSKLAAELLMTKETAYEDVSCVGFHPDTDILYATIRVKLNSGYSGNLCSSGSREYVRFYVDWDGDGDFDDPTEDVGVASVNVHDIPGPKPLGYCVALKIAPEKKPCTIPQKLQVRAILSWNAVPPPNTPNHVPVWGEVEDRWIQIKPSLLLLADFVKMAKVKPDADLMMNLDMAQPVAKPATLSVVDLKELYRKVEVPIHRIHVKQVAMLAETAKMDVNAAIGDFNSSIGAIPEAIKAGLIEAITSPSDVRYEELHCVGLRHVDNALVGVLTVKLPYGYSGSLCTAGSQEYVAFWADWDNSGTFDEYLGTAAVNVHDLPDTPAGGLQYAVSLPVNLAHRMKPCTAPQVARIRAILSWHVPPPTSDPNYHPIWGNRVDTLVQIPVGESTSPGESKPFISAVGDMAVMDIDAAGYATGTAVTSGFQAKDSPFGGLVTIAGHIANAPNLSAGQTPFKYCVTYHKVGSPGPAVPINNTFRITISQWDGAAWTQYHQDQMVDGDAYYTYREDLKITPPADLTQRFVEGFVLGKWYTGGLEDGLYEVQVTLKTPAGVFPSNVVRVRLDNTRPGASVSITESVVGGTSSPAAPCGTFSPGCTIKGKFTASDSHPWKYSFTVLPTDLYPNAVSPSSQVYPALTAPGAINEDWQLDTTDMKECGYIVYLNVWDRTIVNSGYMGWQHGASVGFCLTKK